MEISVSTGLYYTKGYKEILDIIAFPRKESEYYWINKSIEIAKVFGSKVIVSHMVLVEYFDDTVKGLDDLHTKNMIYYKENKDVVV